jgi:hypothetical protein
MILFIDYPLPFPLQFILHPSPLILKKKDASRVEADVLEIPQDWRMDEKRR